MAKSESDDYELASKVVYDVRKAARLAAQLVPLDIWFQVTRRSAYWEFVVRYKDGDKLKMLARGIGC